LGPKTLLRDGTLLLLAIVLAVLAMRQAREIASQNVTAQKVTMSA
jgi:hypothetical protein